MVVRVHVTRDIALHNPTLRTAYVHTQERLRYVRTYVILPTYVHVNKIRAFLLRRGASREKRSPSVACLFRVARVGFTSVR